MFWRHILVQWVWHKKNAHPIIKKNEKNVTAVPPLSRSGLLSMNNIVLFKLQNKYDGIYIALSYLYLCFVFAWFSPIFFYFFLWLSMNTKTGLNRLNLRKQLYFPQMTKQSLGYIYIYKYICIYWFFVCIFFVHLCLLLCKELTDTGEFTLQTPGASGHILPWAIHKSVWWPPDSTQQA